MKNLTVPVVFEVEFDPGREKLVPRLMGSIRELGFWETAKGVDAKRIAKGSTIWKVKVDIPQRSFFYFNWSLMKKREVHEEDHYRQADVGVFGGLIQTKYAKGKGEFILNGGCKISVSTHYHLNDNESLAIVGSGDLLGNWKTSGPSVWFGKEDLWSTKFELKQGTSEEFKLVIWDRNNGGIKRWQGGENRVITIDEGLNSKKMFVPWGGRYLPEGMVIPDIKYFEYVEYQPIVDDDFNVTPDSNVTKTSPVLAVTNDELNPNPGELDTNPDDVDGSFPDLAETLATNPSILDVMALLCKDDNPIELGKPASRTFTGDKNGKGDEDGNGKEDRCEGDDKDGNGKGTGHGDGGNVTDVNGKGPGDGDRGGNEDGLGDLEGDKNGNSKDDGARGDGNENGKGEVGEGGRKGEGEGHRKDDGMIASFVIARRTSEISLEDTILDSTIADKQKTEESSMKKTSLEDQLTPASASSSATNFEITSVSSGERDSDDDFDMEDRVTVLDEDLGVTERVNDGLESLDSGMVIYKGVKITFSDDMVAPLLASQVSTASSVSEWSKPRKTLYMVFTYLRTFCLNKI